MAARQTTFNLQSESVEKDEEHDEDIENPSSNPPPPGGSSPPKTMSPMAARKNMKLQQSKSRKNMGDSNAETKLQTQQSDDGEIYAVFEPEHRPYFIYSTIIICCFIMLVELYMNGLDRDLKVNPCPVQVRNGEMKYYFFPLPLPLPCI